jgi:hypothetical protein
MLSTCIAPLSALTAGAGAGAGTEEEAEETEVEVEADAVVGAAALETRRGDRGAGVCGA